MSLFHFPFPVAATKTTKWITRLVNLESPFATYKINKTIFKKAISSQNLDNKEFSYSAGTV